jgi:hypothetical protein
MRLRRYVKEDDDMAGLDDLGVGALMSGAFGAVPLFIGLLALIFIGAGVLAYKMRIGPFYWVGSIDAWVANYEGGRWNSVKDRIRKTTENKLVWWESSRWGDRIPGDPFMDLLEWRSGRFGGRKPVIPALRLTRNNGQWGRFQFIEDPITHNVKVDAVFPPENKYTLDAMLKASDAFLGPDWMKTYLPIIVPGFMAMIMLIAMIVSYQYAERMMGQHIGALASSTNAWINFANATMNCSGAIPIRPPT